MSYNNRIQTLLCYHTLTAPLDRNPTSEIDKMINKLRLKYRTYEVEFDADHGAVILPTMFGSDFGDQIDRYATLVDPKNNEFEVLVERINGCIFLTKGWFALRDFYNIDLGAWVSMVFVGSGKFKITLKDRFGKHDIPYPSFVPPIKFRIERTNPPVNVFNIIPAPFRHDPMNFEFWYDKNLSSLDVSSGFLTLAYQGFCESTMDKSTTALVLVDDCGNSWNCIVIYGSRPFNHFKIGGQWKRMIKARRIPEGTRIKVGAPVAGNNETLYLNVLRY